MLCANGEPRIVLAIARFGKKGNVADNFHNGGVGAVIDIDTGVIISEAINREHIRSPYHPDSKEKILGFKYPKWEQIKEAVCEAAKEIPEMRNVGWDVAINENGQIEFVEGNGRPNYDALQSPDQVGRRFRYEPYLFEIEKSKGIEYKDYPPISFDIVPYKRTIIKRIVLKLIKIKLKYFKNK